MSADKILAALSQVYPEEERCALLAQYEDWRETRPLEGLRILDGTPLFRNTLLKHANLLAAGAEVWVGVGETMPYDPAVLRQCANLGLYCPTPSELARGVDIVLDCAGAFANVPSRFGYAELTRSGVEVYKDKKAPVYVVDDGWLKTFETALGTGDGFVRALAQLKLGPLNGKRVIVFGGGKVGRGIAFRCLQAGASVLIVDPLRASRMQGAAHTQWPTPEELRTADFIVTATGVKDALARLADDLLQSPAILANMGVEDEFGPRIPASRVLNQKRPLNFILEDPTQMAYIDPVMALHNHAAILLKSGGFSPGLHYPTPEDEIPIFTSLPTALRDELTTFEAL